MKEVLSTSGEMESLGICRAVVVVDHEVQVWIDRVQATYGDGR
jgi:hypothetical protein